MRPIELKMHNFATYVDATVPLSELRLAAIVGTNGAGKSTLLDAMHIALFGAKVDSLDRFVRKGTDGFAVSFEFAVGGDVYLVSREWGKQHKATLLKREGDGWSPAADTKPTEVDAKVVQILGVTYAELTMAHHMRQGGLGKWAALEGSERKAWLMANLPNMEVWGNLEVAAKARLKTAADKRARLEGEAQGLMRPGTSTVDELEARQSELAPQLEAKLREQEDVNEEYRLAAEQNAEYQGRQAALQSALSAEASAESYVKGVESRRTNLSGQIADLEAQTHDELQPKVDTEGIVKALSCLEADARSLQEANRQRVVAFEAKKQADQAALRAEDAATAAADKLNAFEAEEAPTCPTCQQETRGVARDALLVSLTRAHEDAELASEKATVAAIEAATAEREANAEYDLLRSQFDPDKESRLRAELEEARGINEQHAARERVELTLATLRPQLEQVEEELTAACDCLADVRGKLSHAKHHAAEVEPVNLSSLEERKRLVASSVEELRSSLLRVELDLEHARKAESRLTELLAQAEELDRELTLLELLAKAYGKNGIPARIIEGALVEIEASANDYLARFEDVGLSIRLATQRENKTGGQKEVLDILVSDSLGESPIESYSGGERTRINFALAVGLQQFLAVRSGIPVDSFVVDEPEYLDASGLNELVNCLHIMADVVPCVLLVSHYDGVAESLPQRLTVSKTGAGSSVEVSA